jgi:polyhydroxyalkanoate synthase subunit PhaC
VGAEEKNQGQKEAFGKTDPNSVDPYILKDPEAMTINLARALENVGRAATAWLEPREKGEKVDMVAEPAVDMVKTLSQVIEYWMADPNRMMEAQTKLMGSYMQVWMSNLQKLGNQAEASFAATSSTVKTDKTDKRFADEDWEKNPFFSFLKQIFLVTSDWAGKLVSGAEGLDPHTRHKAEFYVRQIISALSPSNFAVTNPQVYRETIASNGANLVKGMKMLAEDVAAGKGDLRIRQTDPSKFEIGVNMAVTPGKVIAENDICQIIQYEPATEEVLKRPLLICPPWINKYYVLDLNPEKSFIRWCVEQGHTVFVISWANPDARQAGKDWEAYAHEGIDFALDTVEKATGEKKVNAIGYCVGGTLLAATLALHAKTGDSRIRSATFFTTQVDFTHAGDLKVFVDEEQLKTIENSMKPLGYLDGSKMATAFNMLRSSELIWPYVVNNYLRGQEPTPFDLLYWNSDSTRMPAANHMFYLRNCYLENNLSRGRMVMGGHRLKMPDVTIPIYNLAAKEDHIAPAKSVFEGSKVFGGDVTYVMSGSGHIAGVVNPPNKVKYQYWTGPSPRGEFEDWVEGAQEHPGSWWPHWHQWIKSHNDKTVPARVPGGEQINPIENAPGSYVRVRA